MDRAAADDFDLDTETSCLLRAMAAIPRADWDALTQAAKEAREAKRDRSRLDETLLQATLFYGFPRVVTAFEHVLAAWPHDSSEPATIAHSLLPEQRMQRGRELFAAIYGKNDDLVRAKLASFCSEFHDFVLEDAYGRILSRPGLDVRTRELLAVTALAALGQLPQLVAHARGAMKFGATAAATRAAMRMGGLVGTPAEEALLRASAGLAR